MLTVRTPDDAARAAIRRLHWVCLLLVTHGSLYPWDFALPAAGLDAAWRELWAPASLWTSLGDVVGNVALFVPVGVLMALDLEGTRLPARWRLPLALLLGTLFAFLLQVAQIVVPERDPELSDAAWNAVGLLLGALLAILLRRWWPSGAGVAGAERGASLALVALWLVLEWWPLLPTIDWQHIKDALKPLLLHPQWHVDTTVEAALAVAAVARLLHGTRHAVPALIALVILALGGKLFIDEQMITLSSAGGCLLGLVVAILFARMERNRSALWLVFAAMLWLTIDELQPFVPSEAATPFHYIPFVALLNGSMSANTHALLTMVFWVGLVMVLAASLGARLRGLAVGLSIWLLLLEVAQIWLPGRTADVTPALIPLFWLLVLQPLELAPAAVSRGTRRHRAAR